ncbi:hypothetical protein AC249_AIPGENE26009, partial [Exaiptasia diaphana]
TIKDAILTNGTCVTRNTEQVAVRLVRASAKYAYHRQCTNNAIFNINASMDVIDTLIELASGTYPLEFVIGNVPDLVALFGQMEMHEDFVFQHIVQARQMLDDENNLPVFRFGYARTLLHEAVTDRDQHLFSFRAMLVVFLNVFVSY